ncbi:hypothetical protein Tco_0862597 [Tanacetum coccineum]
MKLEYNMEEFYHAFSDQLNWNNPKGNQCPYDLNKPLPLHKSRGRLSVPADFFFNNDLEYLGGGSTDKKYTTSTTKTKVAKYDVEDMLLLIDQNKLNNLNGDVIVHLVVGLRMYTRRIVIQSRVEDLQLGVEKPQGVIYEDKLKRKRLMRTDELYNFSDGTLTSIRNTLDQMLKSLRLRYNKDIKRRKWTATDQKRTRIMIKDINQLLLHRRIMRS